MSINKEWHQKNRMPKNPSKEQRLKWHIEHNRYCNCRTPSEKLQREIDDYLHQLKK